MVCDVVMIFATLDGAVVVVVVVVAVAVVNSPSDECIPPRSLRPSFKISYFFVICSSDEPQCLSHSFDDPFICRSL
ncbi:hypothetical protein Scep_003520 [Stephania cephalantha]|uniref:Uncharacterized protein n=1 Tax=Stephania cephalantha TaxID=152367 RepID=A0AAP0KQS9_9MAGN